MASDDVIVSGDVTFVSVVDVVVHIKQVRRIMVAVVFKWLLTMLNMFELA